MKKRHPHNKQKPRVNPPAQKIAPEPLALSKVKRVSFYITDIDAPNGKQRKVIALGVFYLEALRHIGIDRVSDWLSKAVDKHCAIHGYNDSWIRIVEYLILQALLSKIEPVSVDS